MLSVTKRIETVLQPKNGYVPRSLFTEVQFDDYREIVPVKTGLATLQGMVVDYLTRYMISGDVENAFRISILGALRIDEAYEDSREANKLYDLLAKIRGLDDESIICACKAVRYDTAFRQGVSSYKDTVDLAIASEVVSNIRVLVKRCLAYFQEVGPASAFEVSFEGGYTDLVSSGDGDYLTLDSLIELKVSKQHFSNKWSLQLLMYYLLGIHSIHSEFQNIKMLRIFNAYENKGYSVPIERISDKTKYVVSEEVLGYKMCKHPFGFGPNGIYYDYSCWEDVEGTDQKAVRKFLTDNMNTSFDASTYDDGIHKISVDDYWTYIKTIDNAYTGALRPLFRYTDYVLFLKKNGYSMFMSVSKKGKLGILRGAKTKNVDYSEQYYYENMERYATSVNNRFAKYWSVLETISHQLQSLTPDEKYMRKRYSEYVRNVKSFGTPYKKYSEWLDQYGQHERLSGRIHGCIVDLDYYNHIYVNPYDGTIVGYYADSMYDKDVYKNVKSLIADQHPEMLGALNKLIEDNKANLYISDQSQAIIAAEAKNSEDTIKVYDYDMYAVSNRIKALQKIHDHKLIQVWYGEVLKDNLHLLEDKYRIGGPHKKKPDDYIGLKKEQRGAKIATIIKYRRYSDIDVQFDDGYITTTNVSKWKSGAIIHPDVCKRIAGVTKKKIMHDTQVEELEKKYLGMTRTMHCGLQATVIECVNSRNLKIRFEDGLIKSGVRVIDFLTGLVSHVQ